MGFGIDETRDFTPINIAVLTVSDTRTAENDTSGDLLASRVTEAGHTLGDRALLRDDVNEIRAKVKSWIDNPDIDAVISTGGTGLTGRDVTVEAVHMVSFETVGLSTLQSRATAGLANSTFIFCLPGSNGACKDGWDKVIKAQLDSRHRPCNMVELMPRLNET